MPHNRQQIETLGFEVNGLCPYCGQEDTVYHRIWLCTFFKEPREEYLGDFVDEALDNGPGDPFFSRLWAPKQDFDPPVADWCIAHFDQNGVCDEGKFLADLPVLIDGSGLDPAR